MCKLLRTANTDMGQLIDLLVTAFVIDNRYCVGRIIIFFRSPNKQFIIFPTAFGFQVVMHDIISFARARALVFV